MNREQGMVYDQTKGCRQDLKKSAMSGILPWTRGNLHQGKVLIHDGGQCVGGRGREAGTEGILHATRPLNVSEPKAHARRQIPTDPPARLAELRAAVSSHSLV